MPIGDNENPLLVTNDIISQVFLFLPHKDVLRRYALVSKAWYASVEDGLSNIDLSFIGKHSDFDEILQDFIGKKFIHLQGLNFEENHLINGLAMLNIVQNNTQIRWVNFSGCFQVSDEVIVKLSEYCPELEELIINRCDGLDGSFLRKCKFKCLRKLHIDRCFSMKSMKHGFTICPTIEDLSVSRNYEWFDDDMCDSVRERFQGLKKLNISYCNLYGSQYILNKNPYVSPLLEELDISGCMLHDLHILFPNLKRLICSNMRAAQGYMEQLETLSKSLVSKNIEMLDLSNCYIPQNFCERLVSVLKRLKNIKELSLRGTAIMPIILVTICMYNTKLEKLIIEGYEFKTDEKIISKLFLNCPNLKSLYIDADVKLPCSLSEDVKSCIIQRNHSKSNQSSCLKQTIALPPPKKRCLLS